MYPSFHNLNFQQLKPVSSAREGLELLTSNTSYSLKHIMSIVAVWLRVFLSFTAFLFLIQMEHKEKAQYLLLEQWTLSFTQEHSLL